MGMRAYVCNQWKFLKIGPDIKFENGLFETENEDLQKKIERSDYFGGSIHFRDDPAVTEAKQREEARAQRMAQLEEKHRKEAADKAKADLEAKERAEKEATEKAEKEAKEKADADARAKAEADLKREREEAEAAQKRLDELGMSGDSPEAAAKAMEQGKKVGGGKK